MQFAGAIVFDLDQPTFNKGHVNVQMRWRCGGKPVHKFQKPLVQSSLVGASLITLRLQHKTTYRYRVTVSLGPHRLMLRPRESHELRLISNDVVVTPAATITWAQDVFGNVVAMASFQAMTDTLVIESVIDLNTIA